MKKILLIIVIVAAVLGVLYQRGFFEQSLQVEEVTQEQLPATTDSVEVESKLKVTDYVPADTVLFLGGKVDAKLAKFLGDFPLFYLAASERAEMHKITNELTESNTKEARFLKYLIDDYEQNIDGTLAQYIDHYGFANGGEYAMYMHGLVPVVNIQMAKPEKLRKLLLDASSASQLAYEESLVGDAKVISWPLREVNAKLLFAMSDSTAVMTFAMGEDAESVIKQRLAQAPATNPFTDVFAGLRQQYGYTLDMVAVVELEKLLSGFLKVDDSTLAKDISRYIPEQEYKKLVKADSELKMCQADILNWLAAAPRMVMAYREFAIKSDVLSAKVHSVWEVNNPLVNQALQQMQGHLASHVVNWNDQAMSFGVAADISQIAPALTSLWQAFTETEVSCEPLKQAQQEASQFSPMMISMMTGMAQGLKGIGLTLFDLKFDQQAANAIQVDAVMTVEADNPSLLLSLLRMVPELENMNIPTDGTEQKVQLPLPYDLNLTGTVKGSHILLYSGDKSSQVRDQIATETLAANGLGASMLVDYKKMIDIVTDNNLLMLVNDDESMCTEALAVADQFQHMDMKFLYHTQASNDGPVLLTDIEIPKPNKPDFDINYQGVWKTAYLDENCRWLEAGIEKIEADSGTYAEKDDTESCDVFKTAYTWKRKGAQIVMVDSEPTYSRENCSEKWDVDESKTTLYCELMHVKADSFMCLYHDESDEVFVQRYIRQ